MCKTAPAKVGAVFVFYKSTNVRVTQGFSIEYGNVPGNDCVKKGKDLLE